MIRIFSLFLLTSALTLLGCTDMGEEPPAPSRPQPIDYTTIVPGIIGVFFKPGTTVEQADQLVKDLGLSFKFDPTGDPVNGVVVVPIGTEDHWITQFKTYAIVQFADRVCVTVIS
jgi:hypothetical protein